MSPADLKSKLESLLFISGDELSVRRFQHLLPDVKKEELLAALGQLQEEYRTRGVRILIKDEKAQMVTAPENGEWVGELVKSHLAEELTPAALETLACIAYREPITKAEIDDLRGVNSIFSLRALAMRGLIEKTKDDGYRVTIDFLKKLGVEKISDLPGYEELTRSDTTEGGAA